MNAPRRSVLVTGAAKRLGRTTALTLARRGWAMALHYNTSENEAHALANEIRQIGTDVRLVQANLEKTDDVDRLCQQMKSWAVEGLSAIVHNASLFEHDDQDPDGQRHRRVNLDAPLQLNEALLGSLPEAMMGTIVHFLDHTPLPAILAHYSASRKAMEAEIPALARRYAPRIRVNGLALGPVLKHPRQSQAHFDGLVAETLLKRPIEPQSVADSVAFLLETDGLTGHILPLDGGEKNKSIL